MNNIELAPGAEQPAGMPRRTFLRTSMLVALPAIAGGFALPKAALAATTYVPPVRARGTTVRSVKDYGAVGDGVHDDTSAFQAAVNSLPSTGGTVVVPAGTYLIDPVRRVTLRSLMLLQMDTNATLVAKPNAEDRAYVLMVYKVKDVEIAGGRIVGDKYNHLGTTGEWGHGIQVRGSQRVTIRDIHVSKCWGDGICIGAAMVTGAPSIYSYDIAIANVVSTDNRRQALTIGRSNKVRVYDTELSYTKGIKPGCGIDIEPDTTDTALTSDIVIGNCWIHHNAGNGIQIYKQVTAVTVQGSTLEYNGGYGILAITADGGTLAGNTIKHNYLEGTMLRTATKNYKFDANISRNNKTRLWGVTSESTPLTTLTGTVKGTGADVIVTTDCSAVQVLTNYYAK